MSDLDTFYILRDHEAVEATWDEYLEWSKQGFDATKRVAVDTIGDVRVSTVFLMIDHNWLDGPPILFETMVFGGPFDEWQWRYHTWDEAVAGHRAIVAGVEKQLDLEKLEVGT
jgi:hypothetical protein